MAGKQSGLRQQVKVGTVSAEEALTKILSAEFQNPTIVAWLQSRIRRGVKPTPPKAPEPPPVEPTKAEKFPSKSVERRVKLQREHGKKRS
jgi:hypothetical protein